MSFLKNLVPAIVTCGSLAAPCVYAHEQANVTPLLTKPLPEFPGKEILMISVVYPLGSVDPIHRHNAHGLIYVLEGTIVMQVKGGEEVTLTRGQTFYEGPNDIHTVGRNASSTESAKFLVFFVKEQGAPVVTVEQSLSLATEVVASDLLCGIRLYKDQPMLAVAWLDEVPSQAFPASDPVQCIVVFLAGRPQSLLCRFTDLGAKLNALSRYVDPRPTPGSGTLSHESEKQPCQMRLIGKTAVECDFA